MNVNNRAIAIALATVGVVGLAAVPSMGQRAAPSTSKNKSETAMRSPAKNAQFKTGSAALNSRRSPNRQVASGDGGIAGATTGYATNFEAPFVPGNINTQQGWTVFPTTTTGSTISNAGPLQGAQSLQLADDAAIASGNFSGAETPTIGVVGPGRFTVTFTANISANGGADYVVDAISNTDSLVVGKLYFFFADVATQAGVVQGDADSDPGDILVLDDLGSGLQFVATGREYTPGAPTVYSMEIDNDANRVKYFQGSNLIYVGDAISPQSGVEAVDFYSDNFQNPGETGKFDVLTVEAARGLCAADVVRNNNVDVVDLLAVINGWGPCPVLPGNCVADIVQNNAVDVVDLLAVINTWGPCAIPTGACCTNGSCSPAALYQACISGGGTYQGNGVTCASVTCPPPPPNNDICTGATVISFPFTESVTVANYTPDVDPGSNSTCVAGVFSMDGSWWYRFTAASNTTVSISTCASPNEDTLVTAYSGSCAGLTQVGCDDDFCTNPAFGGSQFTFNVTSGTTYFLHFETYSGGITGPVSVSITSP